MYLLASLLHSLTPCALIHEPQHNDPSALVCLAPPPSPPLPSLQAATDGASAELAPADALLRHMLCGRLRRWAAYEWHYSALDRPYFMRSEMQELLDVLGLSHVTHLPRGDWALLRAALGQPRRLSLAFLKQERMRLELHRCAVIGSMFVTFAAAAMAAAAAVVGSCHSLPALLLCSMPWGVVWLHICRCQPCMVGRLHCSDALLCMGITAAHDSCCCCCPGSARERHTRRWDLEGRSHPTWQGHCGCPRR